MLPQTETAVAKQVAQNPVVPPKRKPGRPKGAKNKKSIARKAELKDWLLGAYPNGHPLEFMAKLIATPTEAMVSKWGMSHREALGLKVDAAKHLAPYLEQKLPVRVDVTEKSYKLVIGSITTTQEHVVDEQSGVQIKPIELKG